MVSEDLSTSKNMDFYLIIINSVKQFQKLPVGEGGFSKQRLNYYVKELKIARVISKIGYGVWNFNQDEWERFLFTKQVKTRPQDVNSDLRKQVKSVRGHGFSFTVSFREISGWKSRSQFLREKGIAFKNIKVGYGVGQSFVFSGFRVWCLDGSLVVYFPRGLSLWSGSAVGGRDLAFFRVKQFLIGLEVFFGVKFRFNGNFRLRLCKQHFGDVGNLLAKQYDSEGRVLRVVHDVYGEWLLIDASEPGDVKFIEAETVHSEKAHLDFDGCVKPFFNDLLDLSEADGKPVVISDVWKAIGVITKNQAVFDANMSSHLRVLNDLGLGVNELRREVRRLGDRVSQRKLSDFDKKS